MRPANRRKQHTRQRPWIAPAALAHTGYVPEESFACFFAARRRSIHRRISPKKHYRHVSASDQVLTSSQQRSDVQVRRFVQLADFLSACMGSSARSFRSAGTLLATNYNDVDY